jgi:hypothetical protein
MKIRIEAEPGELEARGDEAVNIVRQLAGMDIDTDPSWTEDHVHKADAAGDNLPRHLDHKALRQLAMAARREHVTKIQRVTWTRIQDVLRGD